MRKKLERSQTPSIDELIAAFAAEAQARRDSFDTVQQDRPDAVSDIELEKYLDARELRVNLQLARIKRA